MIINKKIHICTECLNEFDAKDIHIAMIQNGNFLTLYCTNCIKELKITDSKPYKNPRKQKIVGKEKISRTRKAKTKSS
jgi:hypothetical protein